MNRKLALSSLLDQLFTEPDVNIRRYIPDKLAKLGDWGSTEALGRVLLNEKTPAIIRVECAESLGKQGDPDAVSYLVNVLDSPDAELRRTAVWSLGQIGTPNTLKHVFSCKNDKNVQVRRWVIKSSGRIRNPEVISFLHSLYEELESETQLRTEILRVVRIQLKYVDPNELNFWLEQAYETIQISKNKIAKQAALQFLLSSFQKGVLPKSSILEDLFIELKPEESFIRPLVIQTLGYTKNMEFLHELDLSIDLLTALGIAGDAEFLEKILVNFENFSPIIVASALKGLCYTNSQVAVTPFLRNENITIRLAAMKLHACQQGEISCLMNFLKQGKCLAETLHILRYYSDEGLPTLTHHVLTGEKNIREVALSVLSSDTFLSSSTSLHEIKRTLERVSEIDTVWHIRRDARKGLNTINELL